MSLDEDALVDNNESRRRIPLYSLLAAIAAIVCVTLAVIATLGLSAAVSRPPPTCPPKNGLPLQSRPASEPLSSSFCRSTLYRLTAYADERIVTSPNYPRNYRNHQHCFWRLEAPTGHVIRIKFTGRFSLESHSTCGFDAVRIYDGASTTSSRLGSYCGTSLPLSGGLIESTGQNLLIEFASDGSSSGKGFRLLYYASCPGT